MVVTTTVKPKVKTKAKSRYLKAKKQRRKAHAHKAGGAGAGSPPPGPSLSAHVRVGQPDVDDTPAADGSAADGDDESVVRPAKIVDGPRTTGEGAATGDDGERRRKKKRKHRDEGEAGQLSTQRADEAEEGADKADNDTSTEPGTVGEAASSSAGETDDEPNLPNGDPLAPPPARTPTPPYLPSFPLPLAPPAPPASLLARQGLDPSLLRATHISSSHTLPLSNPNPNTSTDVDLGLSDRMRSRLGQLGITELFAVQTALLPWLLSGPEARRGLYEPYRPPRDACVSAPTGSGKTLAYAVPIVEILSTRAVTRLRALVILPTRDLVGQVRETFEALCKGRGLKITTATGAQSFAHEQRQLVADLTSKLQGGSSKADILICTPGRLIDHLFSTPNFSLQHLRFLVIDEADRLLTQSFQAFLPHVLSALTPPSPRLPIQRTLSARGLPVPDAVAPAWLDVPRVWGEEEAQPSCQKLLFSATMTRDPGIIKGLGLRDPKYFIVTGARGGEGDEDAGLREEFIVPDTLSEHFLVCPTDLKPLHLFHLIHSHPVSNALVFTKSADSTTRLLRLLDFFEAAWVAEQPGRTKIVASAYSSELSKGERRGVLDQFKKGSINILVASDLISRGIDISHVPHVVNYDVPLDMRKYVHRAGRTARAGRAGDVWSMVEEHEARFFKDMLKEAGHWKQVKRLRVQEDVLQPLKAHYEAALEKLKVLYSKKRPEA